MSRMQMENALAIVQSYAAAIAAAARDATLAERTAATACSVI